MHNIKSFFKGIIIGIGGIAPGLSGSVLMVIFGLYTKVINAIATLFKDFKKNMAFLLPIGCGLIIGVVCFSRIINYSIEHFEIQTRLAFLGLLIGTIPLFYKEVQKEKKINKHHYLLIFLTFVLGLYFLTFSNNITSSKNLNIFQSFVLGFTGISATIIPGIDGAALLSALGLYGNWLDLTSLVHIDLAVYIPAFIGIITGTFTLSILINTLLKKSHTITFSILFGFFLSIIPSILRNDNGNFISLSNDMATYMGIILFIGGILISYLFSKIKKED